MARKSRRQKNAALPPAYRFPQEPLKTAIYARLSTQQDTTERIETQIQLLRQYASAHPEFRIVDTYVDHGISGTHFHRPAFLRMMNDIQEGQIECILVKDLSRFGRNLVEMGYYLEVLLPKWNVRLIAVNDAFDSSREHDRSSIAVPIKNLVNEMYARDSSRKATAYYELHSTHGDAKILRSTYGYRLDREQNQLRPNPDTAPIVQMIFRWFLMGHTLSGIAHQLELLQVMTPQKYKRTYEETDKAIPDNDRWNASRVKTILNNRTYIGDTVHGKRRKLFYKSIPLHHTPKEAWIIHPNTHPALISREDFWRVQQRFSANSQKTTEKTAPQHKDCFPQKVRCAECGLKMSYRRYTCGTYYVCCGSGTASGCKKRIHEDYLRLVAMEQLQTLLQTLAEEKRRLAALQFGESTHPADSIYADICKLEDALGRLYEGFADSLIEPEDYRVLHQQYQSQKQVLLKAEQLKQQQHWNISRFLETAQELTRFYRVHSEEYGVLMEKFVEQVEVAGADRIQLHFYCDPLLRAVASEGRETS